MGKIYCSECGSKTEFSTVRPSFCSSCGSPFAGASSKSKISRPPASNISDDETDSMHVPDIRKLSYNVDYGKLNKFTGKDIVEDSLNNNL